MGEWTYAKVKLSGVRKMSHLKTASRHTQPCQWASHSNQKHSTLNWIWSLYARCICSREKSFHKQNDYGCSRTAIWVFPSLLLCWELQLILRKPVSNFMSSYKTRSQYWRKYIHQRNPSHVGRRRRIKWDLSFVLVIFKKKLWQFSAFKCVLLYSSSLLAVFLGFSFEKHGRQVPGLLLL